MQRTLRRASSLRSVACSGPLMSMLDQNLKIQSVNSDFYLNVSFLNTGIFRRLPGQSDYESAYPCRPDWSPEHKKHNCEIPGRQQEYLSGDVLVFFFNQR